MLEIAKKINNKKLIAISLNNIGLVYSYQDEYYDKALPYFQQYLDISIETERSNDIMGAYTNIGMLYQHKNNPDSAKHYYQRAYNLAAKLDDKRHIAIAYSLLASIEGESANSNMFYDYSKKAEQIFKQEGYLIDLAALYYDMSLWFSNNNEADSALSYSKKAMQISNEYDLTTFKIKVLKSLAEIYSKKEKYNFRSSLFSLLP